MECPIRLNPLIGENRGRPIITWVNHNSVRMGRFEFNCFLYFDDDHWVIGSLEFNGASS
jgi:hypothetical protein